MGVWEGRFFLCASFFIWVKFWFRFKGKAVQKGRHRHQSWSVSVPALYLDGTRFCVICQENPSAVRVCRGSRKRLGSICPSPNRFTSKRIVKIFTRVAAAGLISRGSTEIQCFSGLLQVTLFPGSAGSLAVPFALSEQSCSGPRAAAANFGHRAAQLSSRTAACMQPEGSAPVLLTHYESFPWASLGTSKALLLFAP